MLTLRSSGTGRWAYCSGAPLMEAHYPEDEQSPEAREGVGAHHFGTELIQGRSLAPGSLAPNGQPITDEMVEAGMVWAQDVWRELAAASPTHWFRVEQFVQMHGLIHPQNEGTLDAALVDASRKLIIVWDYKYGHKFVDVFRNLQLIDYFAGVLEAHEFTLDEIADWSVSFRIVQPRCYQTEGPIQTWETTVGALAPTIEWLARRAELAAGAQPPTTTGPHCDDCLARAHCAALLAVGGASIDRSGESIPQELPVRALGLQLKQVKDAIRRLEALESGLEEVIEAHIRRGQNVPFFDFKDEPGRLHWEVTAAEVVALGDMLGVNLRKSDTITPTQAIAAGVDESVINAYAKRKIARKLVLVDNSKAAKVFS